MILTPVDRLENVPPDVYPHRLSLAFPRIVQRMADLWGSRAIESYFQDLMLDSRGNRHGFPSEILMEILALRTYHRSLLPRARRNIDTWSDLHDDEPELPLKTADISWSLQSLQDVPPRAREI